MTGSAIPAGAVIHSVAGEQLVLLPDRAIWIPERRMVIVADLHWGKAAAFRAAFVPVPFGTTASDLARLSRVLHDTAATHLVVLGDLLHARAGRHADTLATIGAWREVHAEVAITLVRGNHDAHAGDPPASLDIVCVDAPFAIGPFIGVHEPAEHADGYVLAGHLHPCVSVFGRGRQHARLAAFVFGPRVGVLPAFSSFTGTGMYERSEQDTLFVIAERDVIAP
ncbi:ligase-associated DNA damage response endonuclease PdeM [Gemmatimonas groenlandica]|uniref:Ligase-associated DNA damage response endonuclease PdeM n=1 Tax=Gemmatimonas groenlandica TaxID=2732249 RepID=A0A6M4ITN2_9BACT|nr:ligase-associated DNA damage response endonuclease PdeM [Gemmatimonas groenlandica]QJR37089.1 ligase-associated DNA damage response endonuclease PdeM [Gemmatimonas groenlandica]